MNLNLLTISNPKTQKGVKYGYLTAILHLAPAELSGFNVCPHSTAECRALCLNTAGRGGMFKKGENTNKIQECRIRRTKLFFEKPNTFMFQLVQDIFAMIEYAKKRSLKLAIRLNGTSDILWEKYPASADGRNIFQLFPEIQFYDYTKIPGRKNLPANYHLTFSLSETNTADALAELDLGRNIATVFHVIPEKWANRTVINGDDSDLRFLDPAGVIVGLKAKGRAKKVNGNSKFVH